MARHTDYAPVPNTCPDINEVISYIDSVRLDMIAHEGEDVETDKRLVLEILEKIRSANSQLREWGNGLQNELFEVEKDRDYYEKQCSNLTHDNEYYQNEITQLQNQLA